MSPRSEFRLGLGQSRVSGCGAGKPLAHCSSLCVDHGAEERDRVQGAVRVQWASVCVVRLGLLGQHGKGFIFFQAEFFPLAAGEAVVRLARLTRSLTHSSYTWRA